MKRLAPLFAVLAILVAACAPAAVPGSEEVVYNSNVDNVYATVVRAISTSPGIPGSNGWIITNSDSEGGFITATTSGNSSSFLGIGGGEFTEQLSVVVSPQGDDQTAVVIQGTPGASDLAQRVIDALEAEHDQA